MRMVTLGGGLQVSALGLGCMGLSEFFGPTDREASLATLRRAADVGMTLLDTSDYYGVDFANERLIGGFLRERRREEITIATKFAAVRAPGTGELIGVRGDPAYVRDACQASLRRLGTDHLDLYYLHHPDTGTPVEDTVGAMAELVAAGKVRHLGLSNVSAEQLRAGHRVHPIAAVQNEWSLFSRGFLTGRRTSTDGLAGDDLRRALPRFAAANAAHNASLLAPVRDIAQARGVTMAQVALAWLLHRQRVHGVTVVPIPGTSKPSRVVENAGALDIHLTGEELAALEPVAAKVAGDRMPPPPDL